ncbi:MAG: inner membrane protein [Blastocatellia bacterium]|jgi:inner membrane protein|nr:inner membrane protein [Blastocatellia bacterium]
MDGLTHSLVGLTSAKAGLERLSPYTAAACILSANAPDIDVVSGFFGGRWVLLQHHRGITHSIVGTLALGILIPSILFGVERVVARWRNQRPKIRYRGLLVASLIAAATHPLMDWTNNYGVRPLLPWDGRWFYGDLVFIVDPYLILVLGGAAFLLTSDRRWKTVIWSLVALIFTIIILRVSPQRAAGVHGLNVARTIWLSGVAVVLFARSIGVEKRLGRLLAWGALSFVLVYWGALAWAHRAAYHDAEVRANAIALQRSERFVRAAAMPTAANPFQWQCVAETDRAIYRFFVVLGDQASDADANGDAPPIERYEKPTGQAERLVAEASRDPRAQILLGFARFPIARVDGDCPGQALVQFADLRYTEPGASRGNFSLTVPVECPAP